jgi:nucleoside-diphosphate-sugar epimerase
MQVVILGCGYVGLSLGRRLGAAGHDVVGVRRSADGLERVAEAGLEPVEADVTDRASLAAVPDADRVVFAASADGRSAAAARETYLEGVRTAVAAFAGRESPPERFCYTSSTGVYGDHGGAWVDETTPPEPDSERAEVLVAAETAALSGTLPATVARFAGLYGPDRYRLRRYLEGPVPEGYLNLLHREDAAGAVARLLDASAAAGETVLVVDDEPVARPELARWLAERCGVETPAVARPAESRRERADKRCSNDRLHELGYELTYPTYRAGYEAAIEQYRRTDATEDG